jgi:tripartite-type tricarboxylate transporter receptor subunit TctC
MVAFAVFFVFAGFAPDKGFAQGKYPSKPITFVVGYLAGGSVDISARALCTAASKILGQPIIIENKPGGSNVVAMTYLKNQPADGYTLGAQTVPSLMRQYMAKVPFDSANDFTPISQYVTHNFGIAVNADSPWKTLKEFIDYAKANPGKIKYGTPGPGSIGYLAMAKLTIDEKIKWIHVPFEGGIAAQSALLGKHVDAHAGNTEWKPYVEAGQNRLLATFGKERFNKFPKVPTLKEMGYNVLPTINVSVAGPKGLPANVVQTLDAAFKKATEDPEFIKACDNTDQTVAYLGPVELKRYIDDLHKVWGPVFAQLNTPAK